MIKFTPITLPSYKLFLDISWYRRILYLILIHTYNVFWSNLSQCLLQLLPSFHYFFLPTSHAFFKKFNTNWVHLVLPVSTWLWDHLLVVDNSPSPHPWRKLVLCLSHYSIAVKKHHDKGSAYKGKHLIEGLLIISEV